MKKIPMGDALVTATLITVALAGVFQIIIGGLRLGHLMKFIPYPVVSGFMTGSAILMVVSGFSTTRLSTLYAKYS